MAVRCDDRNEAPGDEAAVGEGGHRLGAELAEARVRRRQQDLGSRPHRRSGTTAPRELAYNVAGGFNILEYTGDGSWLVYSRRDDENNAEMVLYDINAKKEYNVTQRASTETAATLTPDGKYVVFTSNRDGGKNQLFAVSLARLTEDPNDPLVRQRRIPPADAAAGRRWTRGPGNPKSSSSKASRNARSSSRPAPTPSARISSAPTGARSISRSARVVVDAADAVRRPTGTGDRARTGRGDWREQGTGLFAIDVDGRDRRRIAAGTYPGMTPTADRRTIFFRASGAAAAGAPAGRGGGGAATGQEIHKLVLATPQREDA